MKKILKQICRTCVNRYRPQCPAETHGVEAWTMQLRLLDTTCSDYAGSFNSHFYQNALEYSIEDIHEFVSVYAHPMVYNDHELAEALAEYYDKEIPEG